MRKPKPSTALAVLGDVAQLPATIVAARHENIIDSRSAATRRAYAHWWRDYERWCIQHDRETLGIVQADAKRRDVERAQAMLIDTISGYLTYIAMGRDTGKPMAATTLGQAFSALAFAHRLAHAANPTDGSPVIPPLDLKHPMLREAMRGARRKIAEVRSVRKALPVTNDDLKVIIDGLSPTSPRDARDACLLTLGWGRRRSEITGLDWERLGKGKTRGRGFVTLTKDGITITLMTGKTHQTQAKEFVLPRIAMPTACQKLEEWIRVGKIDPGTPLFRRVVGAAYDRKRQARGEGGQRGASRHRASGRWQATIWLKDADGKGRLKHLGYHDTETQAAAAFAREQKAQIGSTAGAGTVMPERLSDGSVNYIVKARYKQRLKDAEGDKKLTKAKREAIEAAVKKVSAHSLRSGFITSASQKGVSIDLIMEHSGHKSYDQVHDYVRNTKRWSEHALKSVGW